MAGTRVLLTLNPLVYEALKKKAGEELMTLQELISDTLRKSVLNQKKTKKTDKFLDQFSRKR
ncbi:hypothetical protein FJZ53_03455 [Candidatus Woesearchaeota archaeon]|nr:hypothetical protein [Candidatus Woesearchaeota archaeon]